VTAAELIERIAEITGADPERLASMAPESGHGRREIVLPGHICERLVDLAMVGEYIEKHGIPS
jgi:hypothetical protein